MGGWIFRSSLCNKHHVCYKGHMQESGFGVIPCVERMHCKVVQVSAMPCRIPQLQGIDTSHKLDCTLCLNVILYIYF